MAVIKALAAFAIWTALAIALGVLLTEAACWIRQHRRDRMK